MPSIEKPAGVAGATAAAHPAPLSANLYCDRGLDDVLRRVVSPLSQRLERRGAAPPPLWFTRYARRGQHLKLRIHADEAERLAIGAELEALAGSLWESLPPRDASSPPRLSNPALPAIDREDEPEEDCPDRSLLWTRYRPSPLTFGNECYLADPRHLDLFCDCLSAHTRCVLRSLAAGAPDAPAKLGQPRLLQAVIAGLFALDLTPAEQLDYLRYHRDWHLRYLLSQSPAETRPEEVLANLDRKVERTAATVESLSAIIAEQRARAGGEEDDGWGELRAALAAFFAHVSTYRGRPEFDVDPYTSDAAFLPLFKVLHGIANQLDVAIYLEMYTYQLILRSAERLPAMAGTGNPRGV